MSKSADLLINYLQKQIDEEKVRKADICRRAEMSAAQLDAYLKRTSTPGLDVADRLAQAVGQTLGEILRGQTKDNPFAGELQDIIAVLSSVDKSQSTQMIMALRAFLAGAAHTLTTHYPRKKRGDAS